MKGAHHPRLKSASLSLPRRLAAVFRSEEDPRADIPEAALFEALKDSSWLVRRQAAQALIRRNPEREARPILEQLGAWSEGGPSVSADDIVKYGLAGLKAVEAARILGDALKDPDRPQRFLYALALGETKSPAATAILVETLRDDDADVRSYSARSLGESGDRSAIDPLLSALEDPSKRVRRRAREALARLKT